MAEHRVLTRVTPEAVLVRATVIDRNQGVEHRLVRYVVTIGLIYTDKTTHDKILFE
ncbi:hypothetical protein D3C77_668730 [compost metagenome]